MNAVTQARLQVLVGTVAFLGFDQATKWLVNESLLPGDRFRLIPGIFQLTLTYNTGAAFSLLNKNQEFLIGLSGVILLLLLIYLFTRISFRHGEVLSLALLLGGTLGNLTDRILTKHVTDFFDVVCIHYPIFNMADIFILFGALGICVSHFRSTKTVS